MKNNNSKLSLSEIESLFSLTEREFQNQIKGGDGSLTQSMTILGGNGTDGNPYQLSEVIITPNHVSVVNATLGMLGAGVEGALAISLEVTTDGVASPWAGAMLLDASGRFSANMVSLIGDHDIGSNFGGMLGYALGGDNGVALGNTIDDMLATTAFGGVYPETMESLFSSDLTQFGAALTFADASSTAYGGYQDMKGLADTYGFNALNDAYNNIGGSSGGGDSSSGEYDNSLQTIHNYLNYYQEQPY